MSNQLFSSGVELANFLVTSDLLHLSWDEIKKLRRDSSPNPGPLFINEASLSNFTIITFVPANMSLQGKEGLTSSSTPNVKKYFEFLCSKRNPSFCINQAAIDYLDSHYDELLRLKNKLVQHSNPTSFIIITGHSMGGCVATLFTLWLFESLDLIKTKRPLCITFGSPLIGNEQLRKCVLDFSTWSSCFLNVASTEDPAPKLFLSTSQASVYKPFGTFLLCSASASCACFEEPESILELLVKNTAQIAQSQGPHLGMGIDQFFEYGEILEQLKLKACCKDASDLGETDQQRARIITQLLAIGVNATQPQPNTELDRLIGRMVERLPKPKTWNFAKFRTLINLKKKLANLEWYKKQAKENQIGYYDMYRNQIEERDQDIEGVKNMQGVYWEDMVKEVENKPQKEGAALRTRWLYGGTNYRRMFEPLHIADYYKDGASDYKNKGRPQHFIMLEQWLKEEEEREAEERRKKGEKPKASPSKPKKDNVASSLNEDSCFWANVEEAIISCQLLKNGQTSIPEKESSKQKLIVFEGKVLNALKNYAVTPDIFLKGSSFMNWWKEYKEIVGNSSLARFMNPDSYLKYEKGSYIFP